jgi:hypothetical protein
VSILVLAAFVSAAATPAAARATPSAAPIGALLAAPKRVTPEQAARTRAPIQQRAASLSAGGDARGAGMELDAKAAEHADPVLFLDAADAYYEAGSADRHVPTVEAGIERARIALDILHFLQDPSADKRFKIVSSAEISGLIARANEHLRKANELIDEIEAENLTTSGQPTDKDKPLKKMRGNPMVIGGAVLTGLGVAGLGVGIAGLVIGKINQNNVEDPTVYGAEYDDFEEKGKRGNMLAWVGLPAGAVLAAVGITLIAIGLKRGKKPEEQPVARIQPAVAGGFGGLVLTGRF